MQPVQLRKNSTDQLWFIRMIVVAVISINAVYPGKYLNRAVDPDFEEKSTGSGGSQTEVASKHMF